jgi:septal ring factor EnvC (AmiA/AmiB activator)
VANSKSDAAKLGFEFEALYAETAKKIRAQEEAERAQRAAEDAERAASNREHEGQPHFVPKDVRIGGADELIRPGVTVFEHPLDLARNNSIAVVFQER